MADIGFVDKIGRNHPVKERRRGQHGPAVLARFSAETCHSSAAARTPDDLCVDVCA